MKGKRKQREREREKDGKKVIINVAKGKERNHASTRW